MGPWKAVLSLDFPHTAVENLWSILSLVMTWRYSICLLSVELLGDKLHGGEVNG